MCFQDPFTSHIPLRRPATVRSNPHPFLLLLVQWPRTFSDREPLHHLPVLAQRHFISPSRRSSSDLQLNARASTLLAASQRADAPICPAITAYEADVRLSFKEFDPGLDPRGLGGAFFGNVEDDPGLVELVFPLAAEGDESALELVRGKRWDVHVRGGHCEDVVGWWLAPDVGIGGRREGDVGELVVRHDGRAEAVRVLRDGLKVEV